jgi:SPP1 gp7 family putative phage head morphogenesis protein
MRFNLASLIRRNRRRPPKEITLRSIEPTAVLTGDLQRIILRVVRAWWEASRDQIVPAYRHSLEVAASQPKGPILDDANQVGATSSTVSELVDRLILTLTPSLQDWALKVEKWHRNKWNSSLSPTGVQLGTLLGPDDVTDTLDAIIQANVGLIRSISSEARSRIEGIVFRGFTARASAQQVAREISAGIAMSRTRAINIASDQMQKLSAALDTARMEQAGITEFIWVHSGKVHYRPWHRARNGQRFPLRGGSIPPDDMPGVPPFCGCRKQAVLSLEE